MKNFEIVFLLGIGVAHESCPSEECRRKPTLDNYKYLLDVSLCWSGIFVIATPVVLYKGLKSLKINV